MFVLEDLELNLILLIKVSYCNASKYKILPALTKDQSMLNIVREHKV